MTLEKNDKFDIVLDDSLYLEYFNFTHHREEEKYSRDKVYKILRFSGGRILTNLAQLKRLNLIDEMKERYPALLKQLINASDRRQSLESISKKTYYKIVLTDDASQNDFPYVHLENAEIEPVLGGFVAKGGNRENAIKHLNSLCRSASSIILYDKHFSDNRETSVRALLSIIPAGKELTISYHHDRNPHLSDACIEDLKRAGVKWTFKKDGLKGHHDRYLIIDDEIEIIITSGFHYLNDTEKEAAYIIRPYKARFR